MRKTITRRRVELGALLCAVVVALSGGVVLANAVGSSSTVPRAAAATTGGAGPLATPSDGGPGSGARPAPIIYRPANLSPSKPAALVVALHASGGTPALFQAKSQWNRVADAHGFVVAYLGSAAPAWKDPSNVAYISAEIDRIKAIENIDPRRVYVTGFSAGAYISYFVGCELSDKVAAIAPVSDSMAPQSCHLARPLSELLIMGTNDIVPLQGNARFPSVSAVEARWRGLDHCPAGPIRSSHVGPVAQQTWGPCADGSAVALYIINGGRHVYPGSAGLAPSDPDAQFNASDAVWSFFAAHVAGALARPSANLLGVRVQAAGARRAVISTLSLQEGASVLATLTGGAHAIVSRRFTLRRSGKASLLLRVPVTANPGRYTARLKISDAYRRSATLSRTIRLP
jgi:polyhydroxybutyrate depolymerase